MEKIIINLNPKKTDNKLDIVLFYQSLLKEFIKIFSFLVFLFFILIFINNLRYYNYKKNYKILEPDFNKINDIKKELSILEKKVSELRNIATPKIFISNILEDIYLSLPENIWLEDLSYKNLINIKGYVVKLNEDPLISVNKFINNLQKRNFYKIFNKINIKDSKKTNFYGVEVLEFSLQCAK